MVQKFLNAQAGGTYELALNEYHKVNPELDIIRINNASLYPHMEIPEKIHSLIETYIEEMI